MKRGRPEAARFADAQATAVAGRAGLWALTDTSAIFRPRGAATGGLPVNPRLLPALQALDADNLGHTLLNAVNRFPVEIGVAPQRSGVWTTFSSHSYVIQVAPEVVAAETKTVATALLHELAHVSQLVERNLAGTPSDCFGDELEALSTQALFWVSLHGLGGKSNPNHQLERELNRCSSWLRFCWSRWVPFEISKGHPPTSDQQDLGLGIALADN